MARITPAGFQNHIQNPLAQVLWAVLSGAQDMRRDEREWSVREKERGQDRADREQQQLDALRLALGEAGIEQLPGGEMNKDRMLALLASAKARDLGQRQQTSAAAEKRAGEEHAVNMAIKRNAAVDDHPIMRTARDIGGGLKDILETAIRSSGRQQQERPQTVSVDGVPHYLTPQGLVKIPMAAPGQPGAAAAKPPTMSDETVAAWLKANAGTIQ